MTENSILDCIVDFLADEGASYMLTITDAFPRLRPLQVKNAIQRGLKAGRIQSATVCRGGLARGESFAVYSAVVIEPEPAPIVNFTIPPPGVPRCVWELGDTP